MSEVYFNSVTNNMTKVSQFKCIFRIIILDAEWIHVVIIWFFVLSLYYHDIRGLSEFCSPVFIVFRMATLSKRILKATRATLCGGVFPSYICGFYCRCNLCNFNFCICESQKDERLTLLATIVVSIQILIGALVVTKNLDIMIVTAHLPIGVALFGITLLVFLRYRKDYLTSVKNGTSGNLD